MNKFLILCAVGIITSFSLKGQCDVGMYDIYTPVGSAVVTFLMCESSASTRAYWNSYIAQTYPNAVQMPTYDGYSSTRKFNCYGYAWLRVEQGIWDDSPYGTTDSSTNQTKTEKIIINK
jgi:hypothetical protein